MNDTCKHCGDSIRYILGDGWVHIRGGSHFAQRCDKCGAMTSQRGTPAVCHHCGEQAVFHLDHQAEPGRQRHIVNGNARVQTDAKSKTSHAASILANVEKNMIKPDQRALRHLAPRRAPTWMG